MHSPPRADPSALASRLRKHAHGNVSEEYACTQSEGNKQ